MLVKTYNMGEDHCDDRSEYQTMNKKQTTSGKIEVKVKKKNKLRMINYDL